MRNIVLAVNSLGQRGTDRVSVHLARGFAEAGLNTELLVFRRGGTAETVLAPMVGDSVRVTYLGGPVVHHRRDVAAGLPAFVGHLKRIEPACLIASGNHMDWVCAAASAIAGESRSRLVLKVTNAIERPGDNRLHSNLRRTAYGWAFAAADRVLTLTESQTQDLGASHPREAAKFVPVINPYVTPAMLSAEEAESPRSRAPLILAVASFSRTKRLDRLIEAFARTATPGARLALVGDGVERSALEDLIQKLGITHRVELPGYVDNVAAWFSRADVMALTSRYEGLPAAILEAMAANCPVVCTDCFIGARELVGEAEGCAVVPADPDAIARALDEALQRPRPKTLRAHAERYSLEAGVRSHIAAIQDLL
jgi:glycosyltransferase involved in cell wall biosynthesis